MRHRHIFFNIFIDQVLEGILYHVPAGGQRPDLRAKQFDLKRVIQQL